MNSKELEAKCAVLALLHDSLVGKNMPAVQTTLASIRDDLRKVYGGMPEIKFEEVDGGHDTFKIGEHNCCVQVVTSFDDGGQAHEGLKFSRWLQSIAKDSV